MEHIQILIPLTIFMSKVMEWRIQEIMNIRNNNKINSSTYIFIPF